MGKTIWYLHPDCAADFRLAGPDGFDWLWNLELPPLEPANLRRGGFSQVARLSLGESVYYLKRQENQMRRTWRHPLRRPTYHYEYDFLRRLGEQRAPLPQCAVYGERVVAGTHRAVLVTRALDGFRDLEQRAAAGEDLLPYMPAVGRALYWFHSRRLQHMAVQPRHLFVNDAGECRIIDMERSRYRVSGRQAMRRDLAQLVRRSPWLGEAHLQAILSAYPPGWQRAGYCQPDRTAVATAVQQ